MDIEQVRRGVYCGAIGFIGFNGHMDTNMAIRTVTIQDRLAVLHAGSCDHRHVGSRGRI
ncbi:chorismate-binding protein [Bradyrhizobium hereditatis]|uniref:chorismate-binding protein n=1 Tax=Bradyrhizobium hereditatis TaxID=2821405 RepID=UPI0028967A81|nr:chorismate-binding protein [Bradyrhizobium hereditatis]